MSPLSLRLLSVAAIAAQAVDAVPTGATCQEIAARLPGRISYPGEPAYNNSQSNYYSMLERELAPGCVFAPVCADEVSQFVKIIAGQGRYKNDTPNFAIRTGGHKYFAGAANIAGGITVDMRGINGVSIDFDTNVTHIGGGSIFSEDTLPYLDSHKLAVAGGRLPGIGIGGFVSGGGLSFLARAHGWAVDTTVGYQVVLGTGEIVEANANKHADLYMALKGGSNNFGVITRFDMQAHPQDGMLGGVIMFPYTPAVLDAQAEAFSNFMKPENFDPDAMMGVLIIYQYGVKALANSLFYLKPDPAPKVYEAFINMPNSTQNNLVVGDTLTIVEDFGAFTPPLLARAAEINYSFKNSDASVYSELFQIYNDSLVDLEARNISGVGVQWLTQPAAVTTGVNSLGLPANVTDSVIVDIVVAWNNTADDAYMDTYLTSLMNKHVDALNRRGLHIPWTHLNYAGKAQDPIGSYGQNGEIKRRMQGVSRKYDPRGIFQTKVPGGFKLFK